MILIDVCLYGFRKIPFTCSYLPGKTHLAFAFLIGFGTLLAIIWLAADELRAMEDPPAYVRMIAGLVLVWAAAGWCTKASVRDEDVAVEFEESMTPAVQLLGLTRDGVTVIP
jgi:type VI protein secretion system component VasK